jgi:predicted DNA-binding transcriptional regulator YafY
MQKAIRLLMLCDMLCARSWTARELAMALGVSKRTIERDLLDLQGEPLSLPLMQEGWSYRRMERSAYV